MPTYEERIKGLSRMNKSALQEKVKELANLLDHRENEIYSREQDITELKEQVQKLTTFKSLDERKPIEQSDLFEFSDKCDDITVNAHNEKYLELAKNYLKECDELEERITGKIDEHRKEIVNYVNGRGMVRTAQRQLKEWIKKPSEKCSRKLISVFYGQDYTLSRYEKL